MKKITLFSSIVLLASILYAQNQEPSLKDMEFNFGLTGIFQKSSNYKTDTGEKRSYTESSASFDMEIKKNFNEQNSFNIHIQAGNGDGLDNYIATFSGLNSDAYNDANLSLTEAWYDFQNDKFALKIGKFGLAQDFDVNNYANSETEQFLAGSFVNNSAIEFPIDNGATLVFKYNPLESISLLSAISESDSDWNKTFQNAFYFLGIEAKTALSGLEGNYRLYAWYNGSDRNELMNESEIVSSNQGFALSVDQTVNKYTGVFLRFGIQDEKVSEITQALSTGLSINGALWNREDDNFALAFGLNNTNEDLDIDTEKIIETYYNFKLNDNLNISPNLQFIINPLGNADQDTLISLGLRSQINF